MTCLEESGAIIPSVKEVRNVAISFILGAPGHAPGPLLVSSRVGKLPPPPPTIQFESSYGPARSSSMARELFSYTNLNCATISLEIGADIDLKLLDKKEKLDL